MANSHISGRIQFEQIVAGVLRMISEFSRFKELSSFINTKLLYVNSSSDEVDALRHIIVLMKELEVEGKVDKFSYEFIESQISLKTIDDSKCTKVLQVYNNWLNNDKIKSMINQDGCFEAFVSYIKVLQIFEISESFGKHLNKNEIDPAVRLMDVALHKISKIGNHDKETVDGDDLLKIIEEDNAEGNTGRALYLGNPLLDELIEFEPQTLNGFIAVTNGGKSAFAHHLAVRCVRQGMRVWWGVLEDRKKSFTYKIISLLSGIPIRRLKKEYSRLSSTEKESLIKAKNDYDKYIKAEFIYGTSVEDIHKAALDYDTECRLRNQEIPIVNIVDYTGHIAGRSFGDKMYEKLRTAYGLRKDFALKHNKICFDFAQINREGSKNMNAQHVITQNDLSGSFDLAQVFDNIISINRSPDDIMQSSCRLHICKARDAATGITVRVRTEFDKYRYNMQDWELVQGSSDVIEISKKLMDKGSHAEKNGA